MRRIGGRWVVIAGGSPRVGYGHVARGALLADEIARAGGSVALLLPEGVAPPRVAAGVRVMETRGDRADLEGWTADADVVIADAPDDALATLAWLRHGRALTVCFRMYGMTGLEPFEEVSLTPAFEAPSLETIGRDGGLRRRVRGRDLVLVRPGLFAPAREATGLPRIVVSAGGADPLGIVAEAAAALEGLRDRARITVVVGALDPKAEAVEARFGRTLEVVRQGGVDFDRLLLDATLAVINGGLTRYECIAARTPFVAVSMNDAQAAFTERVVAAGFGAHAGVRAGSAAIRETVTGLLDRPERLEAMRRAAMGMLDPRAGESLVARLASWGSVGAAAGRVAVSLT